MAVERQLARQDAERYEQMMRENPSEYLASELGPVPCRPRAFDCGAAFNAEMEARRARRNQSGPSPLPRRTFAGTLHGVLAFLEPGSRDRNWAVSHSDWCKTALLALAISTLLRSIYVLIGSAALHWQG
jgi:hypothetical protein